MKSLATTAISVLDLAKFSETSAIAETFAHSRELAQRVEQLGYTRFWLAEHHNIDGIASAATSVLIGNIAEHTTRIRVGSGGIMLPNHAPLVIAEQFGTLGTLYPGRIDLGLGRAPGSDRATMHALRRDSFERGADFGDLIEELLSYFAPARPGQVIRAIPGSGVHVPIYILGSSLHSGRLAAKLGRPYAFAGHFAPAEMMEAFAIYRKEFRPSEELKVPYVMVGIPVIAAETDDRAKYLSTSLQQAFLGIIRGDRRLSKPPVANLDLIWSPEEKAAVESRLGMLVTGSPERIRKQLDRVIQATGADELIITSDTYDPADRLKSFELIAEAKGLNSGPSPTIFSNL